MTSPRFRSKRKDIPGLQRVYSNSSHHYSSEDEISSVKLFVSNHKRVPRDQASPRSIPIFSSRLPRLYCSRHKIITQNGAHPVVSMLVIERCSPTPQLWRSFNNFYMPGPCHSTWRPGNQKTRLLVFESRLLGLREISFLSYPVLFVTSVSVAVHCESGAMRSVG